MDNDNLPDLKQEELEWMAEAICQGQLETLSRSDLLRVLTFGQYLTDRGLAELERRGELEFEDGGPLVPYCSEHAIDCALTRPSALVFKATEPE